MTQEIEFELKILKIEYESVSGQFKNTMKQAELLMTRAMELGVKIYDIENKQDADNKN